MFGFVNKRYFYPLLFSLLLAMLIPLRYVTGNHMDHTPAITAEGRAKPIIYVTSYSLKYLTSRITGNDAEIVQLDASSVTDPGFRRKLSAANLIIITNFAVDSWLSKVDAPPSAKIVEAATPENIAEELSLGPAKFSITNHGNTHNSPKSANFGWLDPMFVLNEADAIFHALIAFQPNYRTYYHSRFIALQTDLLMLHEEFKRMTLNLDKKPLLSAQSYLHHFARRYRLQMKSMDWDPDKMPVDTQWRQLAQLNKTYKGSWMVWAATPPFAISEKLHDLGIRVLVFDPCTSFSPEGDYLTTMYQNAQRLQLMDDNFDLKEVLD